MIETVLLSLILTAVMPPERSDAARQAFAKAVPCPSTGRAALPCPGYIIDHLVPLCFGGADRPENMQWQTVADAKKKDVFEKQACACRRGQP